jgi:hypothetical protein
LKVCYGVFMIIISSWYVGIFFIVKWSSLSFRIISMMKSTLMNKANPVLF